MAPIVVGGLVAGWLLERFGRCNVMVVDAVVRGAVVAVIPLLNAFDMLALWCAYTVATIYGCLMIIFPRRSAGDDTVAGSQQSSAHRQCPRNN